MAQFRAIIQGSRGSASRLGGRGSGISGEVNGWSSGISVSGYYNEEKGMDFFTVTLNEGNGYNKQAEQAANTVKAWINSVCGGPKMLVGKFILIERIE